MTTAKVFENGRSQAVRLPKEYRFNEEEILINKIGDIVMLIPKGYKWKSFISSLALFTDDFLTDDFRRDESSGIRFTSDEREEL